MQRLKYLIVNASFFCISVLPFWALYLLSDFIYVVVRYIFKYRSAVILDNLNNAFPDIADSDRIRIRDRFYRHLCDTVVETIKLQSVSAKTIKSRIKFDNVEIINKASEQNQDVIAILAHYNNWEWLSVLNLYFNANGYAAYNPLKNTYFDKYMKKIRSVFKTQNIPMKDTMREVINLKNQNQRYVLGLIADQSPGKANIHYQTYFLNQLTPVIFGPEKLAKKTNDLVVFIEMHKIKRGYYRLNVVKLFDNPKETKLYEITDKHVHHLEQLIVNKPEYWLWSHRRWKFADPSLKNTVNDFCFKNEKNEN